MLIFCAKMATIFLQYILWLTRTVDNAKFGYYFAVADVAARDAFLHYSVEIPVRTAETAACLQHEAKQTYQFYVYRWCSHLAYGPEAAPATASIQVRSPYAHARWPR